MFRILFFIFFFIFVFLFSSILIVFLLLFFISSPHRKFSFILLFILTIFLFRVIFHFFFVTQKSCRFTKILSVYVYAFFFLYSRFQRTYSFQCSLLRLFSASWNNKKKIFFFKVAKKYKYKPFITSLNEIKNLFLL